MLNNLYKRRAGMKNMMVIIIMLIGVMLFGSCSTFQPSENGAPKDSFAPNTSVPITEDAPSDQPKTSDSAENISEAKEFNPSEDMQLGELKVDMPKSEIDKFMKAEIADTKLNTEFGIDTEILTYDDGTVIHLVGDEIYSISVNTADYPTPRGLRVGDTEDILKQLYGEPTAIEDEGRWIYSSGGYDLFFVTVKDGVIVNIMVSQVM